MINRHSQDIITFSSTWKCQYEIWSQELIIHSKERSGQSNGSNTKKEETIGRE